MGFVEPELSPLDQRRVTAQETNARASELCTRALTGILLRQSEDRVGGSGKKKLKVVSPRQGPSQNESSLRVDGCQSSSIQRNRDNARRIGGGNRYRAIWSSRAQISPDGHAGCSEPRDTARGDVKHGEGRRSRRSATECSAARNQSWTIEEERRGCDRTGHCRQVEPEPIAYVTGRDATVLASWVCVITDAYEIAVSR
jgi:hypothetical protein